MNTKSKIAGIIGVVIVVLGVLAFINKGKFIAAWVNGGPVWRSDVVEQLEKMQGKNVLESLITRKLIEDEAQKKGISMSQDEINAEISKIEEQIKAQGNNLDNALKQQGMTRGELETQIAVNSKLQKLLGDLIKVTEEDIQKFITDNKVEIPKEQEQQLRDQIATQISQQKISSEAQKFIESLKSAANIKYFVNY